MIYYTRKSPRIPMYDYSSCNYYFITICTHNKLCLFGSPDHLSEFGQIAKAHLEQLSSHYDGISVDKYVVMPNHIHMILILPSGNQYDLNQIIGQYKSGVTRMNRKIHSGTDTIWQRSYHDHIIRNQKDYEMIWLYIHSNPANWKKDCFCNDPTTDSAL